MARRDGAGVRLIHPQGRRLQRRVPFIAIAVTNLAARSCLIDGEAIVTDDTGLAVFELLRRQRTSAPAVLCAFDLLELDGADLRRLPVETRKRRLAKLLKGAPSNIVLNEHSMVTARSCSSTPASSAARGIVSKRLGSLYRSGRSPHWVKVKHPKAPAINGGGRGGMALMGSNLRNNLPSLTENAAITAKLIPGITLAIIGAVFKEPGLAAAAAASGFALPIVIDRTIEKAQNILMKQLEKEDLHSLSEKQMWDMPTWINRTGSDVPSAGMQSEKKPKSARRCIRTKRTDELIRHSHETSAP